MKNDSGQNLIVGSCRTYLVVQHHDGGIPILHRLVQLTSTPQMVDDLALQRNGRT